MGSRIMFCGVKRKLFFILESDNYRTWLWRVTKQQRNTGLDVQRHCSRTALFKVYEPISFNSRSSLVVIRGAIISQLDIMHMLCRWYCTAPWALIPCVRFT
ncbi:hypothetical protein NPIL_651131 [Nephila pilipes]|uniref:Uncharacterized protein n=1 Tax=Nephila pilipes TaxID=299642 RepID=A0A8X6KFQ4_NEPPI|nr:hypothetical protein NPIL_231761 [Nephila pilipes]GFT88614.1 hypothetical protein NPIL_651131 [Nephila pilipes]